MLYSKYRVKVTTSQSQIGDKTMSKYSLLSSKERGRAIRINSGKEAGRIVEESVDPVYYMELRKKAVTNFKSSQRNDLMSSLGLNKVRGSVSGKIYWE